MYKRQPLDRESAFEVLRATAAPASASAKAPAPASVKAPARAAQADEGGLSGLASGAWKAANSPLGRQIVRGLMGAFFGGRRR